MSTLGGFKEQAKNIQAAKILKKQYERSDDMFIFCQIVQIVIVLLFHIDSDCIPYAINIPFIILHQWNCFQTSNVNTTSWLTKSPATDVAKRSVIRGSLGAGGFPSEIWGPQNWRLALSQDPYGGGSPCTMSS